MLFETFGFLSNIEARFNTAPCGKRLYNRRTASLPISAINRVPVPRATRHTACAILSASVKAVSGSLGMIAGLDDVREVGKILHARSICNEGAKTLGIKVSQMNVLLIRPGVIRYIVSPWSSFELSTFVSHPITITPKRTVCFQTSLGCDPSGRSDPVILVV